MTTENEVQKTNTNAPVQPDAAGWDLLQKAVLAGVEEQRRSRRWSILFKSLTFIYLFGSVFLFASFFSSGKDKTDGTHTAVIEVRGEIAEHQRASADKIIEALHRAYESDGTRGVILRINSPGGSPVQSGYVYDEINRLRELHPGIPVHAVITDLGASGAYYIASAADSIYADKASLVGSIGVTSSSFGFVGALEKIGVERRVYASGEHKAFLDPFQPQNHKESQFWQTVLASTHQQFIDSVKRGRGDRLKDKQHPELFSGLVWNGEQALSLGLIDGLGSAAMVARDIIGEEKLHDFTVKERGFARLTKQLGASIAESLSVLISSQDVPSIHLR